MGANYVFFLLSLNIFVQQSIGSDLPKTDSKSIDARRLSTADELKGRNDLLCWVQLSDLHISSHYPYRLSDLEKYGSHLLRIVKPSVVLLTGDLTDAKNKERTCTKQQPASWEQYSHLLETFSSASGLPLSHFLDVRGNHDTYEVPRRGGPLDFFSRHSATARKNQTLAIAGGTQTLTLKTAAGREHLFVGLDVAPRIGLRGPLNFVARADPMDVADLVVALHSTFGAASRSEATQLSPVKVVFGHYPLSFTWGGRMVKRALLEGTAAAFVNGHLHRQFGKRLYRYHKAADNGAGNAEVRGFWEWESADWRESRVARVMASDNGLISFVNVEFPLAKGKVGKALRVDEEFDPRALGVVLVTSPIDARLGQANIEPLVRPGGPGTPPQIRALIFWDTQITQVEAVVYDRGAASSHLGEVVEKVHLSASEGSSSGSDPLFAADWDPSKYMGASADRYWISVAALSSSGRRISSEPRPFSASGHVAPLRLTWRASLALGVQWEEVYPYGLWAFYWATLLCLLLLPALWGRQRKRAGDYEAWAPRRLSFSLRSCGANGVGGRAGERRGGPLRSFECCWVFVCKAPALMLWALAESSMYRPAWLAQVAFFVNLALFPWFWGRMLGDDQSLATMSVWGVNAVVRDGSSSESAALRFSGLAQPDTFILVVPFLVTAVLPTLLWIVAFNAFRSWWALRRGATTVAAYTPLSTADAGTEAEAGHEVQQEGAAVRPLDDVGGRAWGSVERGVCSSGGTLSGRSRVGSAKDVAEEKRGGNASGWWSALTSPWGITLAVTGVLLAVRVFRMLRSLAGAFGVVAIIASPGYSWLVFLPVVAMCCKAPPHPKCF